MSLRSRSALALAGLLTVLIPSVTVQASTVEDAYDTLVSARDKLVVLRTRTFPSDDTGYDTLLKDLRKIVKDAKSDVSSVGTGSDEIDPVVVAQTQVAYQLFHEEAWETLEWIAVQTSSGTIEKYEDLAPDVVGEITKLNDDAAASLWGGERNPCLASALGSSQERYDVALGVIDELTSTAKKLETRAAGLRTADDVELMRRRVEQVGAIASAQLIGIWRLSEGALEDLRTDVESMVDRLILADTAAKNAVGSSVAQPIHDAVIKWEALLQEDLDRLDDEGADDLGTAWRSERSEHADAFLSRTSELQTRIEDAADDAETTYGFREQMKLRRDGALALWEIHLLGMSYSIPLSMDDDSDLVDDIVAAREAAEDLSLALGDRAPSGWDAADFEDEAQERLESDSIPRIAVQRGLTTPNAYGVQDSSLLNPMRDLSAYRIMTNFDAPYRSITRAEFLKLVTRTTCMDPSIRSSENVLLDRLPSYADVGFEYSSVSPDLGAALLTALDWQIISGIGGGKLAPDRPVTRFEAAKILVRVYDVSPSTYSVGFRDLAPGEQQQVVDAAVAAGFFLHPPMPACYKCTPAQYERAMNEFMRFRPNDPLTRAEAAKILVWSVRYRGFNLTTNADFTYPVPEDLFTR